MYLLWLSINADRDGVETLTLYFSNFQDVRDVIDKIEYLWNLQLLIYWKCHVI